MSYLRFLTALNVPSVKTVSTYECYLCPRTYHIYAMAKLGYILVYDTNTSIDSDREWMRSYGCEFIVEETFKPNGLRPLWKSLLNSLKSGDELVITRLSNVARDAASLGSFLDFCIRGGVRIVAFHDRLDSADKLFLATTVSEFLRLLASFSRDSLLQRRGEQPGKHLQRLPGIDKGTFITTAERNREMANMYHQGVPIAHIMRLVGLKSRSSVYRALESVGVAYNRGHSRNERTNKRRKGCK